MFNLHLLMIDVPNRALTLTVSQVLQFADCQMLHYWHYVMRRKGADTSIGARDLGTLFHACMESWLNNADVDSSSYEGYWGDPKTWYLRSKMADEYAKYQKEPDAKQLNAADVLSERGAWFVANKGHDTWDEVLAVEKPFRILIDPAVLADIGQPWSIWLRGKGDLFCRRDGETWHMQWKTHAGGKNNLTALTETVLCSLHENLYPLAAAQMFPSEDTKYGGTMLGSFSKAAKHRMVKGAPKCPCCDKAGRVLRPTEGEVHVQFLPIDSLGTDRAMDTVRLVGTHILRQFLFAESWDPSLSPYQPPPHIALQNEHMCTGRFGNALCPMRRGPCNAAGPITDQLAYATYDPLERYEDKTHVETESGT